MGNDPESARMKLSGIRDDGAAGSFLLLYNSYHILI